MDAICYLADHPTRRVDRTAIQRVTGARKREMDLLISEGLLLLASDGSLSATEELVAAPLVEERIDPAGGCTYFIQAEDGGPIKIGSTRWRPEARLAALQTSQSKNLKVIAVFDGIYREKEFHRQFADWRVRGEWYDENAPGLRELVEAG
jgi:hypothetical protein